MQSKDLERSVEILLVEDNVDDAEFTQLAFGEAKVRCQIHHVEDGEAAMTFLRDPSNPRPDVILLDLNMPKMNGQEVLQAVKSDESLKSIPIIILTTSGLETDVRQAYQNYTNSYLCKPVEFEEFVHAISQMQNFWLQVAKRPPNPW